MNASFSVRVTDSMVEVHVLDSHLTEVNVEPVGARLYELAEQTGQNTLRLDFGRVKYLTSSVLGKLISLNKRVKNAGGHFQVVNLGPEVSEVFKATRLDTFIDLQPVEAPGQILLM
jgi:anti-sigma B factor antagonist